VPSGGRPVATPLRALSWWYVVQSPAATGASCAVADRIAVATSATASATAAVVMIALFTALS
jgi:hypothetical protein